MSKPTGGEYLTDDLRHLARMGYSSIVSLLEAVEASELGLSEQSKICDSIGIDFTNVPIKDRSVPSEKTVFINSAKNSYSAILNGANLVAHCRAGIGRSGIYTTSILVAHGYSVEESFALVSDARGFTIPDTQIQIDWVYENQGNLKTTPNE